MRRVPPFVIAGPPARRTEPLEGTWGLTSYSLCPACRDGLPRRARCSPACPLTRSEDLRADLVERLKRPASANKPKPRSAWWRLLRRTP